MDTTIGNAKRGRSRSGKEGEEPGVEKRIPKVGLILAASRTKETEKNYAKITLEALKQIYFEGFRMEEKFSSHLVRYTMQLHNLKSEKQLAEPLQQGKHERKEGVTQ